MAYQNSSRSSNNKITGMFNIWDQYHTLPNTWTLVSPTALTQQTRPRPTSQIPDPLHLTVINRLQKSTAPFHYTKASQPVSQQASS